MPTELFLGSFMVLTLVAVVIMLMTMNKRVDYPGSDNRRDSKDEGYDRSDTDR